MTSGVGQVPASLITWAAGVIGIPASVVAAQINMESGGNPGAVSPTGAQGVAQFEPGTWSGEGCGGSPFNVNDAIKCYAKYMYALLRQEHGSVRDALAAYNAGPGNLPAGYGYADSILSAANQPQTLGGAGGTGNTGGAAGAAPASLTATAGNSCLWGFAGLSILGFNAGGSVCVISKAQGRAVIGAAVMASGVAIAGLGVILLTASVLGRSGAVSRAADVVAVLPGGAAPAAAIHRAGQRASRTGAQAAAASKGSS